MTTTNEKPSLLTFIPNRDSLVATVLGFIKNPTADLDLSPELLPPNARESHSADELGTNDVERFAEVVDGASKEVTRVIHSCIGKVILPTIVGFSDTTSGVRSEVLCMLISGHTFWEVSSKSAEHNEPSKLTESLMNLVNTMLAFVQTATPKEQETIKNLVNQHKFLDLSTLSLSEAVLIAIVEASLGAVDILVTTSFDDEFSKINKELAKASIDHWKQLVYSYLTINN